jgi:prepilin-type N-terminal cleavage/methylation domain-containing protein
MTSTLNRRQSGFTYIELLVTMAILAILATVVLTLTNPRQRFNQTNDGIRRADLAQMQRQLEAYSVNNEGHYPATSISQPWQCYGCGVSSLSTGTTASTWIPQLQAQGYLKTLPIDPTNGRTSGGCATSAAAGYVYRSDGINYKVAAVCTPATGLNTGATSTDYCDLSGNPKSLVSLLPMVDPARPSYAYAVYSVAKSGESDPACW